SDSAELESKRISIDERGNTTTTVTDIAGRTTSVTDAAGNVTTTAYDTAHDLPVLITDAQGNTRCYRYDARGRKVAEWGTGIQSPRGLGGGLDKARSGFAPQGRAGNGVPASQPIATRPLAIRKDGTWYAYGWDLTKNICEVFGPVGYIRTTYTDTPYGEVTATGDVTQPIQWSSEFNDSELVLVCYNYRHDNPVDGRWTTKDPVKSNALLNYYWGIVNAPIYHMDYLGLELAARICRRESRQNTRCGRTGKKNVHVLLRMSTRLCLERSRNRLTIYYSTLFGS
ncbi:MAG: RHS repeat-associated core domain-containing protein, partial [Akkermansia sp.]